MKWIFSEPQHGTNAYILLAAGILWLFLSQLFRSPLAAYLQVIFILGGLGFLCAGIAELLPKGQKRIAAIIRIGSLSCMLASFIAAIWLSFMVW